MPLPHTSPGPGRIKDLGPWPTDLLMLQEILPNITTFWMVLKTLRNNRMVLTLPQLVQDPPDPTISSTINYRSNGTQETLTNGQTFFRNKMHHLMGHTWHDQTDIHPPCPFLQLWPDFEGIRQHKRCKVYRFGVLGSVPSVYVNVFLHAGIDRNATIDSHRIFGVKNAMLSLEKSRQPPPVHKAGLSQ